MSGPLLAFDSFGKSFDGKAVLYSASVYAYPGRITALLGRNGSGKSTLLRVGLGLWRALFYLPDQDLLSRRLSLGEQLELYAARFGSSLGDAVEGLRLEGLLDLHVLQLSGGEERRAELALARIATPRCLIADEPFAGQSPLDRALVARELLGHARRGAALVITGHEVDDLFGVADEVVWMYAGTTHLLGTPREAALHHQFRREYLGPRGVHPHGGGAGFQKVLAAECGPP